MKDIKTFDDLRRMEKKGEYRLVSDIDCGGQSIPCLTGDFNGKLDGCGHTLKDLSIVENNVFTDSQPVALFYTMKKACVKDLNICNIRIKTEDSPYSVNKAVMCVNASDCVFENVTVKLDPSVKTEKIPFVYDSNNCEFDGVKVSGNMILAKFK